MLLLATKGIANDSLIRLGIDGLSFIPNHSDMIRVTHSSKGKKAIDLTRITFQTQKFVLNPVELAQAYGFGPLEVAERQVVEQVSTIVQIT